MKRLTVAERIRAWWLLTRIRWARRRMLARAGRAGPLLDLAGEGVLAPMGMLRGPAATAALEESVRLSQRALDLGEDAMAANHPLWTSDVQPRESK
jgi:hypothetical protein